MLTGEAKHQLDDKGRVVIPRRFREAFAPDGFLTRGLPGCLWLFPRAEWSRIWEVLSSLRLTDMDGHLAAQFLASGTEVVVDHRGRVLIPDSLRAWAGITGDVILLGRVSLVEIWAADRWIAYQEEQFSPERLAEKLKQFSF